MAEEATLAVGAAFSPGRTLSTGIGVFTRNLPAFLAITFVISLPYILLQTWLDVRLARAAAADESGLTTAGFGMFVVQAVTFGFVQAALTYGTVQDLRGQPAGIGECFRRGLARAGSIASGAVQYGLLLGIATALLIIPGIALFVRWWVFMPAMVVEELSPSDAFVRSKVLTAGHRWAILGLAAAIFVAQAAIMIVLILAIESIAGDIALTLIAVLFTGFTSVVAAVGYYHLRAEREGVMIDDIAKVFD